MGVPEKKQVRKGKKGSQKKAKKSTMWGGSPASAMLFDDLANPTNTGNYLDADIPLVANQTKAPLTGGSACRSRTTMTGGSLASSAVMGAVNSGRQPEAQLNDYESGMDLTGCGSKKGVMTGGSPAKRSAMTGGSPAKRSAMTGGSPAKRSAMTGGSAASNRVLSHVNLPSVLKPQSVTSSVPDYLSLDPSARPPNTYELTGGAANHNQGGPSPRQIGHVNNENLVFPEQEAAILAAGGVVGGAAAQQGHARAAVHGKKSKRRSTKRTVQPRSLRSKRTSKRPTMTGGASGFWGGVAGCGPVNVPNAGNTLSKFFTKSSSCPGPDFYANPPGLGSAGSGYATELPTGAPFPFM